MYSLNLILNLSFTPSELYIYIYIYNFNIPYELLSNYSWNKNGETLIDISTLSKLSNQGKNKNKNILTHTHLTSLYIYIARQIAFFTGLI